MNKISKLEIETVVMNAIYWDEDNALFILKMIYAKIANDSSMDRTRQGKILDSLLDAIDDLMVIDINSLKE